MKSKLAPKPYPEGTIYYAPSLSKKENRRVVSIIYPDKSRTTCSYARFLVQCDIGRFLSEDEEVDHINDDKTDDRLENLQILTKKQNKNKHISKLSKQMVKLKCPECGTVFMRERRHTFLTKKGVFTACSRKCCGKLRRKLQLGLEVDFSENILEEFQSPSLKPTA